MRPLWWLAAAGIVPWLVVLGAAGRQAHPEALYGMLAPLAAAAGTWVLVEWTFRVHPERLTAAMVGGLAVKALFFGAYVAVMLRGLDVRPWPFVISFTGFFIVLYGFEALLMKRLFAGGLRHPQ